MFLVLLFLVLLLAHLLLAVILVLVFLLGATMRFGRLAVSKLVVETCSSC